MLPKSSTLLVSLPAHRIPAAVLCLFFVFGLATRFSVFAAEPVRPLRALADSDLPAAVFRRIGNSDPKRNDDVCVAFTPDVINSVLFGPADWQCPGGSPVLAPDVWVVGRRRSPK